MKKVFIFCISLLYTALSIAQINMKDSTVQVIGYWDRHEKQSYTVSHEDYKVSKGDTTKRNLMKYDVDITIIDSTAKSYTIQWDYSNFDIKTDYPFMKKVLEASKFNKAIVVTDELGTFKELANWKEIRTESNRIFKQLGKELRDIPNVENFIKQQMSMFQTKESIENAMIEEIQLFYSFHGGVFKYGNDIVSKVTVPNNYGGKPFDSEITIWVDTLNEEENFSTLCMTNTVDSTQLWNASYDYLVKTASVLGSQIPKKEDFPSMKNITYITSQIHGMGWIIYTIMTKEVEADNEKKVQECIIELK